MIFATFIKQISFDLGQLNEIYVLRYVILDLNNCLLFTRRFAFLEQTNLRANRPPTVYLLNQVLGPNFEFLNGKNLNHLDENSQNIYLVLIHPKIT